MYGWRALRQKVRESGRIVNVSVAVADNAEGKRELVGMDVLAFTTFPVPHWRQIWSNSRLERLNKEIGKRTDVEWSFSNQPVARRLVGAVLAEQHGYRAPLSDAWLPQP